MRKQQADAGDIIMLHQDESEALTHPYLARCWAEQGADLRIEAPGKAKKRAILGVRDVLTGMMLIHTSGTKRSTDFIELLKKLDAAYGPDSDTWTGKSVVIALDHGPIHTSKLTTKALAARPWLTVEWLPKYAPEMNEIERDWLHMKQHYLANQVFTNEQELDDRIHRAVKDINQARARKQCAALVKSA